MADTDTPDPITIESIKEIADAAMAAATEAKTAATAKSDAQTAAQSKATTLGLGDLPAELIEQIGQVASDATVAKLTDLFDINPGDPTPPVPAPGGDGGTGPDPTVAGQTASGDSATAGSGDPAPATKQTWAQKYLGL